MKFLRFLFNQGKKYLNSEEFIYSLYGILLLLGIWEIASLLTHEVILASPYKTFVALISMFGRNTFWNAVFITLNRAIISILLGCLIGFSFGVVAGLNSNIKKIFEPMRWMIMSISPIIVVSIFMIWFGIGTQMVILITSVLLAPIVYVNTIKGIEMVDENLIEMSNVYNYTILQKLTHIYLPAIIGPLSAAMTIVITSGMRVIIMAEILGTNSGIGYEFFFAKSDMNTPELFAWIIVTLIFIGIVEYLIFKPLENYLLRWKK